MTEQKTIVMTFSCIHTKEATTSNETKSEKDLKTGRTDLPHLTNKRRWQ